MKRIFTTLILIALASLTFAQVAVTFNVDMTGATAYKKGDPIFDPEVTFDPALHTVYIAGSGFGSDWNEPGTNADLALSNTSGNIYSITFPAVSEGTISYKFFFVPNGMTSWEGGEWTGDPNRSITIGTTEVTSDNIWGDIANSVNDISNNYKIYPNPSNGIFTVDAKGFSIKVFDVTGKTVATQISGTTVDMSNAQAGVYFVKLTSNDATFTKKIVVR